jgi:hypothetical protein
VHEPGKAFRVLGAVGQIPSEPEKSELEAFFELNKQRGLAETPVDRYPLKYTDISKYYIWNRNVRRWDHRERLATGGCGLTLNRIDTVNVKLGERYYLQSNFI